MPHTLRFRSVVPYIQLRTGEIKRPYLPVRLHYSGRRVDTLGLVDSGADSTVFAEQWALVLGIDLSAAPKVPMAGIGSNVGRAANVRLDVGSQRLDVQVTFAPDFPPQFGLLGQNDFFVRFLVAFDKSAESLYYSPRTNA